MFDQNPSPSAADRQRSHWRVNRRVTWGLLALWFASTLGSVFFARELSLLVLGWPFSYWLAAQGIPLLYLVIVSVYALVMERLDRRYGLNDPTA